MTAFPCKALGLWLPSDHFIVASRLWLGCASRCETRSLLRSGLEMYGRHHALRDCVYDAARSANQRPWREIGVDSSGQRPADCFLPNWSHGRPLAIDVTVSHPSQSRISINAREGLSASVHAAVVKAEEKDRRYLDLCAVHGVDFLPLVICAYGGFLGPGETFISELAKRVGEAAGLSISVATSQLWQRMSMSLWRSNAKLALCKHSSLTRHWSASATRFG